MKVKLTAVSMGLGLMLVSSIGAQEKQVEMRIAHWMPAQHAVPKLSIEPWAKSVEVASKGSIKVVMFPAQQLGKAADHYDMARDGIADMTFVSPGYQAGRFPVFAASELPLLVSKAGPGSAAIDAWYRKYAAAEMKDVKVCLSHLHVGALHSTKKAITDPSELKGMKVRSSNGTIAQTMTLLGATNVQISAPEARDALEKGMAEAITFPWTTFVSFRMDKVAKYHTDIPIYAGTFVWTMNKRWYEALGPGQKKVIDDHCTNEWAAKAGAPYGDWEDEGRAVLAKDSSHKIARLTPAQVNIWKKAVEPVTDIWAKDVVKSGGDPKAVLDSLKKELASRQALF
ncbi:MAG: TRAP transporter substrate-binding protein [Burkholderiaceae bacterium]|nr:TRAP transporter substrate-binding protein [Burkholderiaceae bacterium]